MAQAKAKAKNEGASFSDDSAFTVSLSDVGDEPQFQAMPRGTYDVEVDNVEFGMSQSSGNPMWTWQFVVVDHDEFNGRRLFYHTVFTEGGMPRVKAALQLIEAPDPSDQDSIRALLTQNFDPAEVAESGVFVGARARLKVTTRKYEGELRNNVQKLLAPAAGI